MHGSLICSIILGIMFDFIRKAFVVAEVDGIRFYREKALRRYLEEKELKKSGEGKHMYTFEIPWWQNTETTSVAKVHLEENGCFDYEVFENFGDITIKYWSPKILLKWKTDSLIK